VTLKIKTDGKAGEKITQTATVYTDDPENAKIALTLIGNVIPPADINPQAARLMGKAGEKIQIDIKITPLQNNPFDVTDITAEDGKCIQFHLEKKKDKSNQAFILHIANIKADEGRYFDKIILKTTSAISPEIQIRVFGIIRGAAD
jgi:hypothetical protein